RRTIHSEKLPKTLYPQNFLAVFYIRKKLPENHSFKNQSKRNTKHNRFANRYSHKYNISGRILLFLNKKQRKHLWSIPCYGKWKNILVWVCQSDCRLFSNV